MEGKDAKRPRTRGMEALEKEQKRRKDQQERMEKGFQPGKVIGRNDIVVNHALGKVKLEEDYVKLELDEESGGVIQPSTSAGSQPRSTMDTNVADGLNSVLVKTDNVLEEMQLLGEEIQFEDLPIENENKTQEDLEQELKKQREKNETLAKALAISQANHCKPEEFARLVSKLKRLKKEKAHFKAVLKVEHRGYLQRLYFTDAEVNQHPMLARDIKSKTGLLLSCGKLVQLTTDANPPTYRQLKLVDSFGLPTGPEKSIRKSNRIELKGFLDRFGNQVHCFVGELVGFTQFDPNWYTTLVSWIQLMPNLQQLTISTPNHYSHDWNWKEEKLNFDKNELRDFTGYGYFDSMNTTVDNVYRRRDFPSLTGLKCLLLKNHFLSFTTLVLKNSPNLEVLGLEGSLGIHTEDIHGKVESLKLDKLSTMEISMMYYLPDVAQELYEPSKTWAPKKLKIDTRTHPISYVVSYVKWFQHSLKELELILPSDTLRDYSLPLSKHPELNNLKSLTVYWTGPYSTGDSLTNEIRYLLGKAEILKLKLYNWKNQTIEADQATTQFFRSLNKLEDTSIWKKECHLKQFRVLRTACEYKWGVEIPEEDMVSSSCSRGNTSAE